MFTLARLVTTNAVRLSVTVPAVAAGWLFLFGIGSYPLVDGDAAFYGRTARNAAEFGHWLVLVHGTDLGGYLFDKPPLVIWMLAGSFRLLGSTEAAARLWHALLAVGTVALTARFLTTRLGPRAGVIGGLVLATSGEYFYLAREPLLDIPLTLSVCATIMLIWRFGESRDPRLWLAACASLGLGVMVKGPIAMVIPLTTLAVTAWWTDRTLRRFWPDSWQVAALGAGIALLIVVPWHVYTFAVRGRAYADMYLGTISWRRFTSGSAMAGSALPPYAALLLLGVMPWTGVVCAALASAWRSAAKDRLAALSVVWTLVPLVFFGLSTGPVFIRYLLPAFPGITILCARWFEHEHPRHAKAAGVIQFIMALAVAGGAYAVRIDAPDVVVQTARTAAILLSLVSMLGGWLLLAGRPVAVPCSMAAGAAVVFTWLVLAAPPVVLALRHERPIARSVNAAADRPTCLAYAGSSSVEYLMLAFYLDAPLASSLTPGQLDAFVQRHCDRWVLGTPDYPLPPVLRTAFEPPDVGGGSLPVRRVLSLTPLE